MDNLFTDWPAAQAVDVTVPSEEDRHRACMETALGSDHPAVQTALSHLFSEVRRVAAPDYENQIERRSLFSHIAGINVRRIDADEVHAMLDTVLAKPDYKAMVALDHFISVARNRI